MNILLISSDYDKMLETVKYLEDRCGYMWGGYKRMDNPEQGVRELIQFYDSLMLSPETKPHRCYLFANLLHKDKTCICLHEWRLE